MDGREPAERQRRRRRQRLKEDRIFDSRVGRAGRLAERVNRREKHGTLRPFDRVAAQMDAHDEAWPVTGLAKFDTLLDVTKARAVAEHGDGHAAE